MITHYKGLLQTPAHLYVLQGFTKLYEDGLTDGQSAPAWDDNAITYSINNEIVGIITWAKNEWCKTITLRLGWVSPDFRKRGIYRILWNELVKKAQEENIPVIDGFTHINNITMQEIMKKLAREPLCIGYRYRINNKT